MSVICFRRNAKYAHEIHRLKIQIHYFVSPFQRGPAGRQGEGEYILFQIRLTPPFLRSEKRVSIPLKTKTLDDLSHLTLWI